MAEIRIESEGPGSGELSELHAWLLEDHRTSGLDLAAEGADDGSLGLVDTLIAGISTITSLAALYYTVRAFQDNRKLEHPQEPPTEVVIKTSDGTRLVIRDVPPEVEERALREFMAHLGIEEPELPE